MTFVEVTVALVEMARLPLPPLHVVATMTSPVLALVGDPGSVHKSLRTTRKATSQSLAYARTFAADAVALGAHVNIVVVIDHKAVGCAQDQVPIALRVS